MAGGHYTAGGICPPSFVCPNRSISDSALGHSPSYTYHIRQTLDAVLAPARAALGDEQWAAAFAAGRELTLAEAVAEAQEESGHG
jgi:hypothetical protein